jgi:hypothetical protein
VIEYVTWDHGHGLLVRDVLALRYRTSGHEFLLEETLDRLERLLRLERSAGIEPDETLRVPVFSLKRTA